MSVVDATKDLWLIQNAVGFVSIIKWHITPSYPLLIAAIHLNRPGLANITHDTKTRN